MGASVNINWHPQEFEKNVNVSVASGINAAAGVLARQMVANFVDRSPELMGFAGSRGGASRRSSTGKGGNVVSEPGQFPTNQTGLARKTIRVHEPATAENPSAIVGSRGARQLAGFDYPAALENGTSKMAPRPWCRPAIEMAKARMKSAFLTGARLPNYGSTAVAGASRSMPPALSAGALVARAGSLAGSR